MAAGALTLAINKSLFVGPLFAISSAPQTAANASEAAYLASIVAGLQLDWIFLGFFLVGVGLVLFGWLIWKGGIFPNWLSYLLAVAGILLMLVNPALPWPFIVPPIFLVSANVLSMVWEFEVGIVLLRSTSVLAEPGK